jgi:hypothetical protein
LASEAAGRGQPWVTVIDQASGAVRSRFLAYESSFRGGVRLAVGDLDGDGTADVATASGPGRPGEIRVFRQDGVELLGYRTLPFGPAYRSGVELAVGDVTGDARLDLVAAASRGAGAVRVFAITPTAVDPVANLAIRAFTAFPRTTIGGASVATADIGTFSAGILVDAGRRDGRMEIVVGSGAGIAPLVLIYDVSAAPVVIRRLRPLTPAVRAGLALAAGRYDNDQADDIIVSAGRRGGSLVEVWSGRQTTAQPILLARQRAFAELSRLEGAIFAAGVDDNGDGRIDWLMAAEGTGGIDRGVRRIGGGPLASSIGAALRGPLRLAVSRPRG